MAQPTPPARRLVRATRVVARLAALAAAAPLAAAPTAPGAAASASGVAAVAPGALADVAASAAADVFDDECAAAADGEGGSSCALSALQRRGLRRAGHSAAHAGQDFGPHIKNYALPCFQSCGEGMCESFCGSGNACCKSTWINKPECRHVPWWPTTVYFTCVNTKYKPQADEQEDDADLGDDAGEAGESQPSMTTTAWPTTDCTTATAGDPCYEAVRLVMNTTWFSDPDAYPGITLTSSFEEFQLAVHTKSPAECPRPCRPPAVECQTAPHGSDCYEAVTWARNDGIFGNPEWYPELRANASSIQEFQAHIHLVDPESCPVPCMPKYPRYSKPTFRNARFTMKGISYGPSPLKEIGPLLNDDFMTDITGQLWADWGRADMQVMKDMGANTLRMYGNDPGGSHRTFLDAALEKGFGVIVGMSDFPYLQMQGNCMTHQWDCYDVIYESYAMNIANGFTIDNSTYHPALKALILLNEPDLKVAPRSMLCKALSSAFDAVLEVEKDMGVTGNPIAFTATMSFGVFDGKQPGLGQMEDFYDCMKNGAKDYTPRNDLYKAYQERWVNSFNTANPTDSVESLFLDHYGKIFWNSEIKMPVFIGEYHAVYVNVKKDLHSIMADTHSKKYPFFMGINFFEFSRRYDKGGSEEAFGMFGYGDCTLSDMNYTGEVYKIWDLKSLDDKDGEAMPMSVSSAYGGDTSVRLKSAPCVR